MFATVAFLLAAILGPEIVFPAAIDERVRIDLSRPRTGVALDGNDFVVTWYAGHARWSQRIDGTTGAPFSRTAKLEAIVDELPPLDQPPRVWDGTAYIAVYATTKLYVAAYDANGALLRPPLAILDYVPDDFAIASNGHGSIVFTNGFDAVIRIAPGATVVESRERQPYPFYRLFGAAANGGGYLLVTSYFDEVDVSYNFAPPQPVALEHANQFDVDVAASDGTYFAGVEERERDVVMRFDGHAFFGPQIVLPPGGIVLGGDGHRAAALIVGDAAYGIVLDERAVPIRLGDVGGGPSFNKACAVAPVGDTFLAFWSIDSPTQPGGSERRSTIYVAPFDGEARLFASGSNASIVPHGDTATVVYIDGGIARSVEVDRNGNMISAPRFVDASNIARPAGPIDAYIREAPDLGDAGTRAFVRVITSEPRRRALR